MLARRGLAMLADVAEHEPAADGFLAIAVTVFSNLFFELHVPPGCRAEVFGIVEAVGGEVEAVGGELGPLLACHLARLAADAQRRISEEAHDRFQVVKLPRLWDSFRNWQRHRKDRQRHWCT